MHLALFVELLIMAGATAAHRISAGQGNYTHHSNKRTTPTNKGITIQMFQWNWDSIAAECRDFIGPAGYGLVEVSPPSEHYDRDTWWAHYQPVSYTLTSKHGNRQQFANMVKACNDAGVGVMVDVIWNHMAGVDSGVGTAGTKFEHYSYPGLYDPQDFHHCGTNGDDIYSWDTHWEAQTCELANLADLVTDSEKVRTKLVNFSNDLLRMGVTGFRIDAAKHMPIGDIQAIVKRLERKPFITQEVVCENGANELCSGEYAVAGEVQEFRYQTAVKNAFTSGDLAALKDINNRGWLPSQSANVFVVNHDRERKAYPNLNYKSPDNIYTLSMVFSLAYPYGSPTILSSYEFTNNDAGGPNGGYGACTGEGGSKGWLCQHRWHAVSGMVGFNNDVRGSNMDNWAQGSKGQIAFGRVGKGFVAINSNSGVWTREFMTSLPNGDYCDVVSGKLNGDKCTATKVTVRNGKFTVSVPAKNAIAIHIKSKLSTSVTGSTPSTTSTEPASTKPASTQPASTGPAQVQVRFTETVYVKRGQNVYIVGSIPQLGNWDPSKAIPLIRKRRSGLTWRANVSFPSNTQFEYKFIKKDANNQVTWESGSNRVYTTSSSRTQKIASIWK